MVKRLTVIAYSGLLTLTSGFLSTRNGNIQGLSCVPKPKHGLLRSELKVASLAEDEVTESFESVDNEQSLVLGFVDMILQETPTGGMKKDEVGLLREIMSSFPTDIGDMEAATVVESLLLRLIDEWNKALQDEEPEREEAFRPSSTDFSVAISAWECSTDTAKVVRVLSLLSEQRELFIAGLTDIAPDLSTINSVLRTLATSKERGIDNRALVVFDSLGDYGLEPDAEAYELIVSITAKSRAKYAAERADKLLREGVQKFPPQLIDGGVSGVSTRAFNSVVTAYAKSGNFDGPEKAEELIMYMHQVDTENGSLGVCSPSVQTVTSLIDAYAQKNEWEAASQADRILNQLLDQYLNGNDDLEPSIVTWTIVINAWARLSKKNRKGAAERAGRLLRRMDDLYQAGRTNCRPDAIAYITCMNAYAFTKNGSGAAEAENLLDEMNEYYLDGDDSMKPSVKSVKTVIDSWVKNGNMERAEDLLDKYEDFVASRGGPEDSDDLRDVYRSMLFGYTQEENTSRARFYLEYMIEKGLKPDSFCFDRIIDANTRIAPEASLKSSLEVFEMMEKLFRAGDVEPDERVYTSFIRALTKGKADGMYKKAAILLQRMQKLHLSGHGSLKPTIFTYNAVLYACSESIHLEGVSASDAFKTAVRVFSELRGSDEKPDHVTYGNMIRCSRLLPDGDKKEKFTSATFRLCCEQGYVNSYVVRDLQETVSETVWRDLLGCPTGPANTEDLPANWSYMVGNSGKKGAHRKTGFRRR
eukprot:scaffold1561_cov129-Cylindrotheca_fusiformis.AAC.36